MGHAGSVGGGLAGRGLGEQTVKGGQELAAGSAQAASLQVGAARLFPHKGSRAC